VNVVVPGRGEAAPSGEGRNPPAVVDARGAPGVQTGAHSTQYNTYTILQSAPVVPTQVVCGVIPGRPVGFQPRAALLDELAEVAGSDGVAVVCALTGQRGVGKTQLAAAYARRRIEQNCPLVAGSTPNDRIRSWPGWTRWPPRWVCAGRVKTRRAGWPGCGASCRPVWSRRWWCSTTLTDPDHLAGYLPATGTTQIILTSTQHAVRNLGQTVPIDVYTPGEAIAFLREATGLDDDTGAGELGWLPLALAHAAAVIRTRKITYPQCVRLIRDYPLPRYLIRQPGQNYPYGTAEAILLSLHDTGVDTDPELAHLAGVLALVSPDGVLRTLLTALTDGDATALDDQIECLAGGRSSPTPPTGAR
jgi:hypothetical protein